MSSSDHIDTSYDIDENYELDNNEEINEEKNNKMKTSDDMGSYINSSSNTTSNNNNNNNNDNNNNNNNNNEEGDTDIEEQSDDFTPTQVIDDNYEPQQYYRSESMSKFDGLSTPFNRFDENMDKNINRIFHSQSFIGNDGNQINFKQLVRLKSTLKNYEIPYGELIMEKELGKGFFGKVYKANWRGKSVAVKRITIRKFRELSEQEIFDKELSIMSKLCHPKCVMFIGACSLDETNRCIVMEYMDKGSLRCQLNEFLELKKEREEFDEKNHNTNNDDDDDDDSEGFDEEYEYYKNQFLLPPSLQLSIAKDIAEGMNYLHTNFSDPIIHRDLTSSNILLDCNFTAKINDFGLSKELKPGPTEMTAAMGSLAWMAPECFKAEKYSQKVDVYSFAIILWELLTCRNPYNGMEPLQMAFLASVEDYRLPLQNIGGLNIPSYWSDLISKCWSRDPLKRPTFNEILLILNQIDQNPDYQKLNQIYNNFKNKLNNFQQQEQNKSVNNNKNKNINNNNNNNNNNNYNYNMNISYCNNSNKNNHSANNEYYAKNTSGGGYMTTDTDEKFSNNSNSDGGDKLNNTFNQTRQKTFIIGSPSSTTNVDSTSLSPTTATPTPNGGNDRIKKIKFIEENKAFLISYFDNNLIKYFNIENNSFYGSLKIEKSIVDMKYQIINNKVFLAVATNNSNSSMVNNNSISIFDLSTASELSNQLSSSSSSSPQLPENFIINPIKTFYCDKLHEINSITWNNQNVITASKDKSIKIWDVENSNCISTMDYDGVNVLSIDSQSHQPLMASGGEDGKIKLWDLRNSHCFRTFSPNHHITNTHNNSNNNNNNNNGGPQPITSLAIRSPHTDPILFSGTSKNSTLKVWNMYSSACLDSFRSHSKDLLDIHNNNSVNRLISYSSDGIVSIYNNNNHTVNSNNSQNNSYEENDHAGYESISFIKNLNLNNIDSNNPLQSAQLISKNTIVYSSNNKLYTTSF